ncbi:kinase-like protein [Punctularia strigosozonata HHB-11173 SS5]|uniref:kinase-like protein n=1 Tax=Punctularia strigosozonata (strain HHB-11173) TaxID=741275 RepID=UPI0004416A66|nr:kinase-like protein [Punctularia strigosozonata HHB-11173 SS5]EIN09287.1 kinase-like protein [Punctularia strigosozonata HHB-11173 SS5]
MDRASTLDPTERFVRTVSPDLHALRANNWGYLEPCNPHHVHLPFTNGSDIWFIYTKNNELRVASRESDQGSLLAVVFKCKVGKNDKVKIQRTTADVPIHVNDKEVPPPQPNWMHEPEFRMLKTECTVRIGDMEFIFHFMKDEILIPTYSHRYEVEGIIGEGGEGTVYAAMHNKTGHAVVIKCTSVAPTGMHMMAVQLHMWREMGRHTNILTATDWFMHPDSVSTENKLICVASPLAAYGDLDAYVEYEGALTEHAARSVMLQILEGLMFLHGRGILHRDMKAENILVFHKDKKGRLDVKISDFGLSKFALTIGQSVSPVGTPAWAAPELQHLQFTERSDAYGAGLILFFILFATRPYLLLQNKADRHIIEQMSRRVSQLSLIDDGHITPECEGRRLTRSACRKLMKAQTREDRRPAIELSPECRELLKALTQEDPLARPTPGEARKYRWFVRGKLPPPYNDELLLWEDPLAVKARQRSIYAGTRKSINQWLPREETLYTPTELGSRISDAPANEEAASDPVDALAEAAVNIIDGDSVVVDEQGDETATVVAPVLRRSSRVREQRGARVTRASNEALPKARKDQTIRRKKQETTRVGNKRKLPQQDAEPIKKKRRL